MCWMCWKIGEGVVAMEKKVLEEREKDGKKERY